MVSIYGEKGKNYSSKYVLIPTNVWAMKRAGASDRVFYSRC